MNKLLLSIVSFTCLSLGVYSQSTPLPYQKYFATKVDATYTPLGAGATEVIFPEEGATWDSDGSDPITIPFDVKIQGQIIRDISISTDGEIFLYDYDRPLVYNFLDLTAGDRLSKVYYQTIGTAPNRKFVVEYRNVSTGINYTGDDTVNFQVIIHETSSILETHFGYSNVPTEAFINTVEDLTGMEEKLFFISGVFSNPGDTIGESEHNMYFHYINVNDAGVYADTIGSITEIYDDLDLLLGALQRKFPPAGTVYRFTPTTYSSAKDLLTAADIQLFPNPATSSLQIKHQYNKAFQYNIYDVTGKIIMSGNISNADAFIQIENLSAGNYLLELYNESHNGAFKFVKI